MYYQDNQTKNEVYHEPSKTFLTSTFNPIQKAKYLVITKFR